MAVLWSRETNRDAGYNASNDSTTATRSWLVKADLGTDAATVAAAAGVSIGDAYPGGGDLEASRIRARASDPSGMLWTVSVEYSKTDPEDEGGDDGEDGGGGVPGKPRIWGGSSSVTTVPIYQDRNGDTITNSAGDPLEGLEAEAAEERLTLTEYYLDHTGWMGRAKSYTNSINSGQWNGGPAGTWKCQGCSKKLNIENNDGGTMIYWEVTWEFAWRADGWQPKPWDIGFHELVDEDGNPDAYGGFRGVIKTASGTGTRQPVALQDGVAKAPGEPPNIINVDYYSELDFGAAFGEVFTPAF